MNTSILSKVEGVLSRSEMKMIMAGTIGIGCDTQTNCIICYSEDTETCASPDGGVSPGSGCNWGICLSCCEEQLE